MTKKLTLFLIIALLASSFAFAEDEKKEEPILSSGTFSGLNIRNIGPAARSGRVVDIAIDPTDQDTWYVAVGSGGVWKTSNAGTTWKPIFDSQPVYSIGCITIDPNDHLTVWVGSGENVSGRHVGFGDGVYRSRDGGNSWENVGLKDSMMIAKILVDPRDSNIVYVAVKGNIWKSGGDRGLYKTTDGGKTWKPVLEISKYTGVTDIHFQPGNADIIYAAAYQRERHVAGFMGGGPESGIYKSTDAGASWNQLKKGLPKVDLGKIGLAVSPQKPNIVYATVETFRGFDWDKNPGGFFRSEDGGLSWEKQSDYFPIKQATGPHYYQELFCDPFVFDRIYQMDAPFMVSNDGGKTWQRQNNKFVHGDYHAMAFRTDKPNYLLVGSDGGVYESFDKGLNWRWMPNLPFTQFYKMALDYDMPFYNIVGGTQDNSTIHGPSRTVRGKAGILDTDWRQVVGGDGYACAIDYEDPDTVYGEWQVGGMVRWDRRTGETVDIKPQPEPGEDAPRWNWDAPILISPHSHTRLYMGSQKLYRSDDRGDSWTPISGDLSRGDFRLRMEYMDRTWSDTAVFDNDAMSYYGNTTIIDESPLVEDLIYVGTDDGLIQITEDGGQNWRKVEKIAGVPESSFVNDIKASKLNPDTVFAALDYHKFGDLTPYLMKSTDRGETWKSIRGDLPDKHIVWSIAQDHINENLIFIGTEFGVFFTIDGGDKWIKLGTPPIPFRDIAIQRRENDLVAASFARGFFIFDDYTPLRQITEENLTTETMLFPMRKTWQYNTSNPFGGGEKGSKGATFFNGPNPEYGAVVTYYLPESLKTSQEQRREAEAKALKDKTYPRYPEWDQLRKEDLEEKPSIIITIKDSAGNVVKRLNGPGKKGFHRVAWDMRYPAFTPVRLGKAEEGWMGTSSGPMVLPGKYSVEIAKYLNGELIALAEPQTVELEPLYKALATGLNAEVLAFQNKSGELQRAALGAQRVLGELSERLQYAKIAIGQTSAASTELWKKTRAIELKIVDLNTRLSMDRTKFQRSQPSPPSIIERIEGVIYGHWSNTTGPTKTHRRQYEIAYQDFKTLRNDVVELRQTFLELEAELEAAGAPWTPGREVPVIK
jgi:photosystem II stability/assembly factor-like uncharacterized protein